jgi:hypothetical protein
MNTTYMKRIIEDSGYTVAMQQWQKIFDDFGLQMNDDLGEIDGLIELIEGHPDFTSFTEKFVKDHLDFSNNCMKHYSELEKANKSHLCRCAEFCAYTETCKACNN